ncbi:hypothetical protein KP509_29G001100 [Ceratopteris richardii]|uniref:N-acetyltransferase domain-containing protein n=1 Tax=Ceratopteris richardii TaxID=49495 RepID=A0A8T2R470_CERRI|nr:hypothetical protein KP509_29G001100 [Ceratopteris richardii]
MVKLEGMKVFLVPYRREHVPKYHAWMQDPFLLEITGSEPLSLSEEYAMQHTWTIDPKKCTFIILEKEKMDKNADYDDAQEQAMVGDVNLYMNDIEEPFTAEVEIMIAEPDCRGKGLAREAVQLMMTYAIKCLNISKFRAKIGDTNLVSLHLFRTLGFRDISHSIVFNQVTLEVLVEEQLKDLLKSSVGELQLLE